jgi:hypothetical protein
VTRRVAALPKTWRFPSSENARSYSRWPAVNVSRRDNGHFIVPRSGPADERDQAEPPTRPAGRRASSVEYHDGPDPGPAATWISKDSAGDVNSPRTPIVPAGSAAAMAKRSAGAEALLAAASPHPPPDARVGPSERRWRDTAEHPRRGLGCGLSPSSGRGDHRAGSHRYLRSTDRLAGAATGRDADRHGRADVVEPAATASRRASRRPR